VTLAPRTSALATTIDLAACIEDFTARNLLVWLELRVDGVVVSDNLALLARPKHMEFAPPQITASVNAVGDCTFDLTLTAESPALYVWLQLPDATFSDGFFDLPANRPRTVRVTTSQPMDALGVQASLVIQSLVNTYTVD
jgi:beta-mannosidase